MTGGTAAPTCETDDLLAELLAVTERLIEVVAAETEMLRDNKRQGLADLATAKSKLAVRYDTLMRALGQRARPTGRDADRAATLSAAVGRLTVLARENAAMIDLHLKATRRVLDIIARATQTATQPNFTYGTQRLGYGARSARTVAVAVNRVL